MSTAQSNNNNYTTGQYQTAIDHCTLVTRSQDHSQCSSHVVQGEILPKIDDDVDNIMLGLAELYQHVRTAALKHKRQPQLVSVFTTELFAFYLHMKYLSVVKCSQFKQTSFNKIKRYAIYITDFRQLYIGDVLLFLSVSRLLKCRRKPILPKPRQTLMNANKYSASGYLVYLLQKSAVDHLTTYRQLQARGIGSVYTIVTADFEAMYAFKRGDYERCLQLSTHSIRYYCALQHIFPTFPELIQFLNDDIVSLTALTLIVNPKCRENDLYVCITQLNLLLYLMTQCQLKLRYSLMSLPELFHYIELARRQLLVVAEGVLNRLMLKLIERRVRHISKSTHRYKVKGKARHKKAKTRLSSMFRLLKIQPSRYVTR